MRGFAALPLGWCVALAWAGRLSVCAEATAAKAPELDAARDLPRFPAVEPEAAAGTWVVKAGFRIERAACEPAVRDPVATSFDESGRMFVCEMIDYPEGREATPHAGRLSRLEDADGDGFYEKATVFAGDLAWPTGLICANGGVYVIATPNIFFLKDSDGDGRADIRETIFTGLGAGLPKLNVQGLANSPQWGLDNRIHVQCGGGNRGKIRCLKRPDLAEVELGGRDLWFDPRTFDFGLEAGGGQYGMSFDDAGHRFVCSNSDHLQYFVTDDRYLQAHPLADFPTVRQSVAADGGAAEVFRISPDEPWRIVRTRWRVGGVVKGIVEGGGRVSGYFTGATGTTVYRGDAYGPAFVGNTFTGDAGGQLVHRKTIAPQGASVIGRRPPDEQGVEFAASRDTWVRVVNFANAPDGCLHVIDMYREVIEHPWSLPEEIKKHLDLNSGNDRGRIWRIVPDRPDWKRRGGVKLGAFSTAELVAQLEHPNGWQRDTAARLIYERRDATAVPLLENLARSSAQAVGRLHALAALAGFGAASEARLVEALNDPAPAVREWALRFSEAAVPDSNVAAAARRCVADADLHVRLQALLCLSLRPADAATAKDVAAALTGPGGADPWIEAAAALFNSGTLVQLLEMPSFVPTPSGLERLVTSIAATADDERRTWLIRWIGSSPSRHRLVSPLMAGLKRAGVKVAGSAFAGELDVVFQTAAKKLGDPAVAEKERLQAASLLGYAPFALAGKPLLACLGTGVPGDLQKAAVGALGSFANDRVANALIDRWGGFSDDLREIASDVMLNRADRAKSFVEAVNSGRIDGATLPPTTLTALTQHSDASVATLARSALAKWLPQSREAVLTAFAGAATAKGDGDRGRIVFRQRCLSCHRAANEGSPVGPDFVTLKAKGRQALLLAILDPQREVAPAFIAYQIATKDGQSYAGVVKRDDATGVTVQMAGGVEKAIPRPAIASVTSTGLSLMPVGLEAGLSVQDVADLLTFIETLK